MYCLLACLVACSYNMQIKWLTLVHSMTVNEKKKNSNSVEAVNGNDGVTSFFSSDSGRQCACSYDAATDYFPDKLTPTYAQNFAVEYFKHYKVITVQKWGGVTESYYAYLCGTPKPDVPAGAIAIEIPLRNVGIMSTTMLPAFEYIRVSLDYRL
jgi:hypothetical protein